MKNFSFKIDGTQYGVSIKETDEDGILQVDVNGSTFNVEVEKKKEEKKTPKIIRKPVQKKSEGGEQPKTPSSISIKSPLPGTIMSIHVKEGDAVKKGDKLLVMEAMKMENNVLAEKDGVVTSVKVSEGKAVLQGETLIEFK